MSKKFSVMLKIASIIIMIYAILSNFVVVNAATDLKSMNNDIEKFKTYGQAHTEDINYVNVANEFVGIGQTLTMIGTGVMVAVTTYMGIKYLTSGPEAQAKLKVQLIGIVVA